MEKFLLAMRLWLDARRCKAAGFDADEYRKIGRLGSLRYARNPAHPILRAWVAGQVPNDDALAGVPAIEESAATSEPAVVRARVRTLGKINRALAHVLGDGYARLRAKLRARRHVAAAARAEVAALRSKGGAALTSLEAARLVVVLLLALAVLVAMVAPLLLLDATQVTIPYLDTIGIKVNDDLLNADAITRAKAFTGIAFACTAVVSIFILCRYVTKLVMRTVSVLAPAQILLLEALTALALATFVGRDIHVLADLRDFYLNPGAAFPQNVFLFISVTVPLAAALAVQSIEFLVQDLLGRLRTGRTARRELRQAWLAQLRCAAAVAHAKLALSMLWWRADRSLLRAEREARRASRLAARADANIARNVARYRLRSTGASPQALAATETRGFTAAPNGSQNGSQAPTRRGGANDAHA